MFDKNVSELTSAEAAAELEHISKLKAVFRSWFVPTAPRTGSALPSKANSAKFPIAFLCCLWPMFLKWKKSMTFS